jgi:predicted MFS family arabinose efflux permease
LAAVLSVDSADKGTIGALAPQIESAFHIGNLQVGLLVAISSLIGAAASLPMGVLSDRVPRVRLLYISMVVWAVAETVSGLSISYIMLLVARMALGGVTATTGPAVASLTGDLFPAAERSRIYGYILTGDLLGAGGGLLISGDVGSATSWRIGFVILTAPTLALAWIVRRYLPEPERNGGSRIQVGDHRIKPATGTAETSGRPDETATRNRNPAVLEQVRSGDLEADPDIVIREDPSRMGLWDAVRWVLRVRTNVLLIISSCLGYFFFAGLKTFAVLFARGRYGISQSVASLLAVVVGGAAIAGIVSAGYLADRLLAKGRLSARLIVAGGGYLAAAVIFIPAFLTTNLALALPLVLIGAAAIAAPNSPGDAARLDVVPSRMWGRTEAIRTFIKTVLEALAPLLFGFVSQMLGGGGGGFASGVKGKAAHVSAASAQGLAYTFLVMLAPLAIAGAFTVRARRSYPKDVASAAESDSEATPDTSRARQASDVQ